MSRLIVDGIEYHLTHADLCKLDAAVAKAGEGATRETLAAKYMKPKVERVTKKAEAGPTKGLEK